MGEEFIKSKIIFATLILFVLISLTCVSATDNQTGDVVALETDTQTVEILTDENEGTFQDLKTDIEGMGEELKLERNYTYNGEEGFIPGITVSKSNSVIDGQGHTIDAKNSVAIFNVTGENVTLKNIIFKNGKSQASINAGAVIFKFNGTVENCTFKDNTAVSGSSAIYFAKGGLIKDSTFIANSAATRSVVHFEDYGIIDNCNFTDNGGAGYPAIFFNLNGLVSNSIFNRNNQGAINFNRNGTVNNCNFTNNLAITGAAIIFDGDGKVNNSNFIGNNASRVGGAISHNNDGKVTIENSNFIGNRASYESGGAIYSAAFTLIDNCKFTSNKAVNMGGAIYATKPLTVTESLFEGNILTAGQNGGAIYATDLLNITDSKFKSNEASTRGGAIYSTKPVTVKGSSFDDNKINGPEGGAIYAADALNVSDSSFTNNKAYNKGGAIYANGILIVSGSSFTGNEANNGGAIYAADALNVTDSSFTNNNNSNMGGAIYTNGVLYVNGSSFDANEVMTYGGAIYAIKQVTVNGSSFNSNKALNMGGAIYLEEPGVINNSKFTNNIVLNNNGGAIYFSQGGNVSNSIFTNNEVKTWGGAIYSYGVLNINGSSFNSNKANGTLAGAVYMVKGIVNNSNFTNNKILGDNGGAIYMENDAKVINSNFNSNNASNCGGAIYTKGVLIVTGSSFTRNEADKGGAIYADQASLHINASSFNSNKADTGGALLFSEGGDVSNSIFTNNEVGINGGAIYCYGALNIKESSFDSNKATGIAGAVLATGTLNIEGSSFDSNKAASAGAIRGVKQTIIKGSSFNSNNANEGGAIWMNSGEINEYCEFINNSARDGGALYLNNTVKIFLAKFTFNKASDHGGAIYSVSGSSQVTSSSFLNNRAGASDLVASEPSEGKIPEIIVTFTGKETLINAIYAENGIVLNQVNYWNGAVVITDDVVPVENTYPGINITVEVYSNNVLVDNVTLMTNASSQVKYNSINLGDGNYTLNAYHKEDNYYTAYKSNNVSFTVIKDSTSVEIKIEDGQEFIYGDVCNIPFNVTNRTEVRVVITRDGEVVFNQTVEDDYVNPVLNASDSYNITVYNAGNLTHSPSKDSKLFKIIPKKIVIKVTADNVTYPEKTTIWIEGIPGDYIVDVNGTEVPIQFSTGDRGKADVSFGGGTYYAKATFKNPNYNATIINTIFIVYPTEEYDIIVNATKDIIYGENASVNLTFTGDLPDAATGFINVTVGGNNLTIPVINGVASLNITGLKPGNYSFEFTYSGNENYTGRTVNVDIHVQKVIKIDAANAKYGFADSYEYQAKLVSKNGTALANKTLTFKINNKTINATTDSEGIAKINLTSLNVGSYDILIENELADSVTQKITVLPRIMDNRNMVIDYDSTSFTVKAIGDDGNPISDVIVEMTTNGVKYNVKTDKNGVAKLPIELKPGKYTITSSYNGCTVKNTIKVKYTLKAKKTVKVKKTAKKLVLTATLKWSNGKAIAGKKITFKFKGKKYTVKTNKKGLAKITIKKNVIKKLRKGKTYKTSIVYKNETITTKIKVKK